MPARSVTVTIKDGGGSVSYNKEEEKKKLKPLPKPISPIATPTTTHAYDTPKLSPTVTVQTADGVRGSAGGTTPHTATPSYGATTNPYVDSTPSYGTNTTPTSPVREFTPDDYIRVAAEIKAIDTFTRFDTVPTSPSIPKSPITSSSQEVKPDYSSPTAPWRNPETFQAIPWSDYDTLSKGDKKAYLKAYADNSMFEQQERDKAARAQEQREKEEESDKLIKEHLYGRLINGERIDVSGFKPETIDYIEQRAYEDLSSGKISQSQYDRLPVHDYRGIDNRRAKLYNGNAYSTTQPHLAASGFDRYRTDLTKDVFPEHTNDDKNMSVYREYRDVISKAMSKVSSNMVTSSDRPYYSNNFMGATEDAFAKIIAAIENGTDTEAFIDGVKVRIDIGKNYNSSGLELTTEVIGLIPYLGELFGIVDYMSEEKNNPEDLLGTLGNLFLEDGFEKLPEMIDDPNFSKALKNAGYVSTGLSLLDIWETLQNGDSPDKMGTDIRIFVQDSHRGFYSYHAYVDKDLNFKELFSGYTRNIDFLKDKEFEITVE